MLAGKRVVATRREIDEVKGAHRAYAKIESFNAYSVKDLVGEESRVKSRDKSRDKVLCLLRKQPDLTQAELANALGLTVKAIEKIVRQLRDANLIKREGGKKFGRWIVA